jgi:hypothetical protein
MLSWRAASLEMARNPLTASGVLVPDRTRTPRLPMACRRRFHQEKSSTESVCRSPTTMSAAPATMGAVRVWDVAARVLVVPVGVHDDVGAPTETLVHAGSECPGQPLVRRQLDDVVHAQGPGNLSRAVGGAVVHHQELDGIEALHLPGEVGSLPRGRVSASLKQGIWMRSFMGRVSA